MNNDEPTVSEILAEQRDGLPADMIVSRQLFDDLVAGSAAGEGLDVGQAIAALTAAIVNLEARITGDAGRVFSD